MALNRSVDKEVRGGGRAFKRKNRLKLSASGLSASVDVEEETEGSMVKSLTLPCNNDVS